MNEKFGRLVPWAQTMLIRVDPLMLIKPIDVKGWGVEAVAGRQTKGRGAGASADSLL